MIKFLSNWAKNIGLAIILVSILEMILPENKTKKYIKMVLGTYVLFSIISPFINNNIDIDLNDYTENTSVSKVNQNSANKKINEMYKEEMEKNITNIVEEQGYIVDGCDVDIKITDDVDTTKLNKITLNVKNGEDGMLENKTDNIDIEKKVVSEVQKIKNININSLDKSDNSESARRVK